MMQLMLQLQTYVEYQLLVANLDVKNPVPYVFRVDLHLLQANDGKFKFREMKILIAWQAGPLGDIVVIANPQQDFAFVDIGQLQVELSEFITLV
jgi:hypothetical protein